jgi:hypothetical protein
MPQEGGREGGREGERGRAGCAPWRLDWGAREGDGGEGGGGDGGQTFKNVDRNWDWLADDSDTCRSFIA